MIARGSMSTREMKYHKWNFKMHTKSVKFIKKRRRCIGKNWKMLEIRVEWKISKEESALMLGIISNSRRKSSN